MRAEEHGGSSGQTTPGAARDRGPRAAQGRPTAGLGAAGRRGWELPGGGSDPGCTEAAESKETDSVPVPLAFAKSHGGHHAPSARPPTTVHRLALL